MIKSILCLILLFGLPVFAASKSALKQQLYSETSSTHSPQSYKTARKYLFGSWYLRGNDAESYNLSTYYCHTVLTNADFPVKAQLGPMKIPATNVVNAEHSWPQSKFTGKFNKETQKGDLHILFPVLSQVNSIRGNFPYGEVVKPMNVPCPEAALGKSAEGKTVFEPNDLDKGDVARALFYYSVRYQAAIDPDQEEYLRAWHENDPVDRGEVQRNNAIFGIQKNRNPFVDHPELVEQVEDF